MRSLRYTPASFGIQQNHFKVIAVPQGLKILVDGQKRSASYTSSSRDPKIILAMKDSPTIPFRQGTDIRIGINHPGVGEIDGD